MSEISVFTDKTIVPTEDRLKERLGASFDLWQAISKIVFEKYPDGLAEWNFLGKKYAEGRGIGIEVKNKNVIPDIEMLSGIKLVN